MDIQILLTCNFFFCLNVMVCEYSTVVLDSTYIFHVLPLVVFWLVSYFLLPEMRLQSNLGAKKLLHPIHGTFMVTPLHSVNARRSMMHQGPI